MKRIAEHDSVVATELPTHCKMDRLFAACRRDKTLWKERGVVAVLIL